MLVNIQSNKVKVILVTPESLQNVTLLSCLQQVKISTVASALLERWVAYFGIPKELHSDCGSQYEGEVMKEMCHLLGITKTHTTARRPQSDGLAEAVNKVICNMLNCVGVDHPFTWDKLLPLVMMAYNSSVQSSTKETPNAMVFGRELTLPLSLALGKDEGNAPRSVPEYVRELGKQLDITHHLAREHLKGAALHQQKSYNNRLCYKEYEVGDLVYHRGYLGPRTPKESRFKWSGPYVVVEKKSPTVYKIQKSLRSKSFIVNHDTLKFAKVREPVDTSWVGDLGGKHRVENPVPHVSDDRARPRRKVRAPERLGEWLE